MNMEWKTIHCPICGSDLRRGIKKCPECGHTFTYCKKAGAN
ncbi:MAG: hypothetical protein IMZ52_10200 [Actinobacteria bacterium]|nr:hypothetical protein [Actinomycetota bacterium]